jgi:hypothetical protein
MSLRIQVSFCPVSGSVREVMLDALDIYSMGVVSRELKARTM